MIYIHSYRDYESAKAYFGRAMTVDNYDKLCRKLADYFGV